MLLLPIYHIYDITCYCKTYSHIVQLSYDLSNVQLDCDFIQTELRENDKKNQDNTSFSFDFKSWFWACHARLCVCALTLNTSCLTHHEYQLSFVETITEILVQCCHCSLQRSSAFVLFCHDFFRLLTYAHSINVSPCALISI